MSTGITEKVLDVPERAGASDELERCFRLTLWFEDRLDKISVARESCRV